MELIICAIFEGLDGDMCTTGKGLQVRGGTGFPTHTQCRPLYNCNSYIQCLNMPF